MQQHADTAAVDTASDDRSSTSSADGPWRDGSLLVVQLNRPNLPKKCLATNADEDLATTRVANRSLNSTTTSRLITCLGFAIILFRGLIAVPLVERGAHFIVSVVIGGLGFLVILSQSRKASLDIFLSRKIEAKREETNREAIYGALALLAILPIVSVFLTFVLSEARAPQWTTDLIGQTMLLFMFLAVVFIILTASKSYYKARRAVWIKKVRGEFVWMAGVNSTLLNTFPVWDGQQMET